MSGSSPNYDYFVKMDTSDYKGEWVAIAAKKVLAHGKDAQKVYGKAIKMSKGKKVSLAKIPKEQVLVLKLANLQLKDRCQCLWV